MFLGNRIMAINLPNIGLLDGTDGIGPINGHHGIDYVYTYRTSMSGQVETCLLPLCGDGRRSPLFVHGFVECFHIENVESPRKIQIWVLGTFIM